MFNFFYNSCFHICLMLYTRIFWIHLGVFANLFLIVTIGKKFGFRRRYISFLDRLFLFAESQLDGQCEDAEGDEEEQKERKPKGGAEENEELIICPEYPRVNKAADTLGHFSLGDSIPYITVGMQAIVEDCLRKSLTPDEIGTWNMLSRTKKIRKVYKYRRLTILWVVGFLFRYLILLPVRMVILGLSLATLITCTYLVGKLPNGHFKRKTNALVLCWGLDFVGNALSVVARFHNVENRPQYGIAVANHTSPIDSLVLATDNCYDMVGQKTSGFLGVFMEALAKSSTHIWFERTNKEQRSDACKRMLWHLEDTNLPPVLLFPEGICVNNRAVLLFRKGIFEVAPNIHPIAIKFDSRYGDAFWHQQGFFTHCVALMTSWALVCDVWYLPPMSKQPHESSAHFANRVKSAIAQKGGLEELNWDGLIKFICKDKEKMAQRERTWLMRQQSEFAKYLQNPHA